MVWLGLFKYRMSACDKSYVSCSIRILGREETVQRTQSFLKAVVALDCDVHHSVGAHQRLSLVASCFRSVDSCWRSFKKAQSF